MIKKIISLILSAIMALVAMIPGLGAGDVISQGEWLTQVNDAFGMTSYDSAEPYYENVTAENEYFAAVQIAYEWGVITDDDVIDVEAPVTAQFLAATLVRVARLELGADQPMPLIANAAKLDNAEEVAVAVSYGLVSLQANGKFRDAKVDAADAAAALAAAKDLWATKTFDETKFDYKLTDGAAQTNAIIDEEELGTENGETEISDVFEEVSFQGNFAPDLAASKISDAQGNVLNDAEVGDADAEVVMGTEGFSLSDLKNFDLKNIDYVALLKKVNLSFKVGGFKVKAKVQDNGFNVSVSGNICDGVSLTKSYNLTNLNLNAKLDADTLKNNIKDSYIRVDYDLVETTLINGSYAGSLTEVAAAEGEDPVKFLDKVKDGMLELTKGTAGTVNIFTVEVPIPNLPALTLTLDLSLKISVTGKIELTVTSSEVKGYEIVNNKLRLINNSEVLDKTYLINGNAEVAATLDFGISVLGFCVIDVGVTAGLGINVSTTCMVFDEEGNTLSSKTLDMPFDLAVEVTTGQNKDKVHFCGDGYIYGIVKISLGQKSVILSKIGLSKTWTICDASNATFAHLHLEEGGLVPACTRAA